MRGHLVKQDKAYRDVDPEPGGEQEEKKTSDLPPAPAAVGGRMKRPAVKGQEAAEYGCTLDICVSSLLVTASPETAPALLQGIDGARLEFSVAQAQAPDPVNLDPEEGEEFPDKGGALAFGKVEGRFEGVRLSTAQGMTVSILLKSADNDVGGITEQESSELTVAATQAAAEAASTPAAQAAAQAGGAVAMGQLLLTEGVDALSAGYVECHVELATVDPVGCPYSFVVAMEARISDVQARVDPNSGPTELPNVLCITVCHAKDLKARTGKDKSVDPYVKLSSSGAHQWESQTTKKEDNPDPVWNERFMVPMLEEQKQNPLKLVVVDKNTFSDDTLGEETVDLERFRASDWLEDLMFEELLLRPKGKSGRGAPTEESGDAADVPEDDDVEAVYLGMLKVKYMPMYVPDLDESNVSELLKQGDLDFETDQAVLRGEPPEGMDDEELEGGEGGLLEETMTDKEKEEQLKQQEKEREEFEAEMKRIEGIEVKEGSYTFLVHIIEVRDLSPDDPDGSNDPVVCLEVFGHKRHSKIVHDANSVVFDDLFQLEFKGMTRDDLEGMLINVGVYDADMLGLVGSQLIGSFQADFDYVYYRKNHEFYRQWVALVNPTTEHEGGSAVQGYMLLSINILGPGDRPPYHDRKAEMKEERRRLGDQEDDGLASAIAIMPQITQNLHFLEVTVYRAHDLPTMDSAVIGSRSIDAYILIKFANNEAIKTEVRKVKDKGSENGTVSVAWNQVISLPVQVPTMSNYIEISVWDKDPFGDEVVGTCPAFSFRAVQKKLLEKPFWAPVYGGCKGAASNPLYDNSEGKRQCHKTREATATRGKLLLSLSEDLNNGRRKRSAKVSRRMLKVAELPPTMPEVQPMVLRCAVYAGSDLPSFGGLGNKELSVKVVIGGCYAHTDRKEFVKDRPGVIRWNKMLRIPERGEQPLLLPTDMRQVSDIFVYLVKGHREGAENVCYWRVSPEEVYNTHFKMEPTWTPLKADKVVKAVDENKYPGSLLLRLGLGPEKEALSVPWSPPVPGRLQPVRLCAYVYMGHNLSPSDSSGTLDPYVVVRFNGQSKKTRTIRQTRNPSWFDAVYFDTMLPEDDAVWPQVTVEVWDYDTGLDPDDWVGSVRFPTSSIDQENRVNAKDFRNRTLTRPKWHKLQFFKPEDALGELLLNFELITKDDADDHVPTPISIVPETEACVVELVPIGLRDLRAKGMLPLNKPFVEFRVGDEQSVVRTEGSCRPSRQDPNFKPDAIRIQARLPKDSIFAPSLNVSVYDKLLGGLSKPLLGTTSIPLGPRMKGSPDYRPPGGKPSVVNPYLADLEGKEPTRLRSFKGDALEGDRAEENKGEEGDKKGGLGWFQEGLTRASKGIGIHRSSTAPEGVEGELGPEIIPGAQDMQDHKLGGPKFLQGREQFQQSLEWYLDSTPFEEFILYSGMRRAGAGLTRGWFDSPYQKMGFFKGMIRVIRIDTELGEVADPLPFDPKEMAHALPFQVRLYVIQGFGLRAKDRKNNKSDPYIAVRLGNQNISHRDEHETGVVQNVQFYQYFELKAKFPGDSKLEVAVWDWDPLSSDDMIGTTVIDLEDRWFSQQWRDMGWDRSDPENPKLVKPLEMRSLWSPVMANPQGALSMWIDILPSEQLRNHPPLNIAPPPKSPFEMRVIIYKVKEWDNPGDSVSGLTDMYLRCKMGNRKHWQETDTHLRATTTASFNWRMKFDMTLPDNTEGAGMLHLQVWDFDISYNDMMLEMSFDLSRFIRRGMRAGAPVQYFLPKAEEKSRTVQAVLAADGALRAAYDAHMQLQGAADTVHDTVHSAIHGDGGAGGGGRAGAGARPHGSVNRAGDVEEGGRAASETTGLLASGRDNSTVGGAGYGAPGGAGGRPVSGTASEQKMEDVDHELEGMAQEEEERRQKKKKLRMWDHVKENIGLGPLPPFSGWVPLRKTCRSGDGIRSEVVGQLLVGLELLPQADAEARPAGYGRAEPNSNPVMPDPEGRPDPMKMVNPIYLLKVCLGEGLLLKFCSVICCVGLLGIFFFASPSIMGSFYVLQSIPYGGWITFALLVLLLCACANSWRQCRNTCGCNDDDEDDDEHDV